MASDSDDFQQMLKQIGGKSNIYLISSVCEADGDAGLLQDFIADMFNENLHEETTDCVGSGNGEIKIHTTPSREEADPISPDQSQSEPSNHSSIPAHRCTKSHKSEALKNKTVTSSRNLSGKQRSIKCSVIIFVFGHDYVCNKANHLCLLEILKDVRARVKRNAHFPALLGLILTDCNRPQSPESVDLLDRLIRSVFISRPQEAIWTGHYVTKAPEVLQEIKRNVCKAVKSSLSGDSSPDSKGSLFKTITCLPGLFKKGNRGPAEITSSRQQANPQTTEEGIPLQMTAMPR
ncbi:uncharacterized protein LOC130429580 [Triplophysa dalaica]|uniref:uncharacterized protein LOC130429580 n=1 Tax=Triplophysa dalaica TaxID=1582913 RepID=UPI0024DFE687|nr:uncharacterized protein LOC130429580 [Triplophysa dalaica]